MSGFNREAPTKKVKMVPDKPAYPHVPSRNEGFGRDETSSIYVDSEAIVEERSARPPAPPRANASSMPRPQRPAREAKDTPVAPVPKAGILRVPKPRINRD
jgi:hypothetical protein